jgi:hypothetical protein
MKNLILIGMFICSIPFLSSAQEDTLPRSKIYRTWVLVSSSPESIKGTLYQVADSSVLVANSLNKSRISRNELNAGSLNLSEINYNDMNVVMVRHHSSVARGMLSFALAGASVGALIGALVYVPPPPYDPSNPSFGLIINFSQAQTAGIGAVTGSIIGAGVGTLVGSVRISIPINRNFDSFNTNRERLMKYSYKK